MNKQIAPSILSADFARLGEEVKAVTAAGADRLHVDVMDGHFVPQLTIGIPVVRSLKAVTALPLDVHLMVREPEKFIPAFAKAGAHSLIFHIESTANPSRVLQQIRQTGIPAGVALKPATSVEQIFDFLDQLNSVLIMTVEPGFSGQAFLREPADKINILHQKLAEKNLNRQVLIHVDGGVNNKVLPSLAKADILVSGDFIFKHKDYGQAISMLKNKGGRS